MDHPNIITSSLSKRFTVEGHEVSIDIYKLENDNVWTLEAVNEEGTSTVWADLFDTEQAALDAALRTIELEGLSAFFEAEGDESDACHEGDNIIQFPKR